MVDCVCDFVWLVVRKKYLIISIHRKKGGLAWQKVVFNQGFITRPNLVEEGLISCAIILPKLFRLWMGQLLVWGLIFVLPLYQVGMKDVVFALILTGPVCTRSWGGTCYSIIPRRNSHIKEDSSPQGLAEKEGEKKRDTELLFSEKEDVVLQRKPKKKRKYHQFGDKNT